jgi:hypothetical protein
VGEELLASLFSSCPCEDVSVTVHVAGSDGCLKFSELAIVMLTLQRLLPAIVISS